MRWLAILLMLTVVSARREECQEEDYISVRPCYDPTHFFRPSFTSLGYSQKHFSLLKLLIVHFPAFVQFLSADDVIERIARSYEEDAGPKHEKPRPLRFGR
ncbi:hypothetical protein RB195_015345 [Necator americanus]|uniref:Uncharacterized protein n=1 Tax=Necator americanus TaxID=51031 RepID=A0ABR1E6S3_NECAM